MKKKTLIILALLFIGSCFMYFEMNKPKLEILPYPAYKIKSITIRREGDTGHTASENEKIRIINALYKLEKYEYVVEDHSYPPPVSEITIETSGGKKIYIRNLNDTLSIIDLRYVIRCEEIHKILE